jgi:hypothetical protein
MGYERNFSASAVASAVFVGSAAGGQLVLATNAQRAEAKLQGVDAWYVSPQPSITPSAALFVPSGAIFVEQFHTGPLFGLSAAAGGATIAIRTWESGD